MGLPTLPNVVTPICGLTAITAKTQVHVSKLTDKADLADKTSDLH